MGAGASATGSAGVDMVPRPTSGRVFTAARRVRLGDVTASGRLRVDAIGRYLQDVARDDSADADLSNPMGWVVRRSHVDVVRAPKFQDDVELATWCSGYGTRWAERRTTITGPQGALVETATVWVQVDPSSGRPSRLGPDFFDRYGEAAQGRRVDARLAPEPPVLAGAKVRPWAWRVADFDVLGHVNNAAYGAVFEEAMAMAGLEGDAFTVEIEYREPVGPPAVAEPPQASMPGAPSQLCTAWRDGALAVWIRAGERSHCTGRIRPR